MATKLLILCFLLTYAVTDGAVASPTEAESPAARKLGCHRPSAEAPESGTKVEWPIQDGQPGTEEMVGRSHHHSTVDKSVAGGGVIIGGLATTFLVAVVCYIRVTGKRRARNENETPTV